ncbi:MAG: single-stranded DNA-binding protein [Candidatus Cloacimonadota bacterium]|nr:single-stranded DNA-binding protein [Candidatus Cloacimonadota bacterium]
MKKLNLPRINNVMVSGRLTRDVDLRYTPSGTPVADIGIANDRSYKDSDGNWQNDTNFFQIVAWTKTAEYAAEQLKKGSPVIVEGRLEWSKWQDNDGNKRTTIKIVASRIQRLEREYDPQQSDYDSSQNQNQKQSKNTTNREEYTDDEIPF